MDFSIWICIGCMVTAIGCMVIAIRKGRRVRRNIDYLISAAMNGDFSYKFPVNDIAEDERKINVMLNQLVEHLENLSERARQQEAFLERVINLVDIGIIVANAKGHVIHSNRAALRLLSLPALTHICQLPDGDNGLEIKRTVSTLRGEAISIYTLTDISLMKQTTEVESMEKLTRVLTHEIMNSLTPVHSISETLSHNLQEDMPHVSTEELRRQLDAIRSSSRSLMAFVKNFRKCTLLPEPDLKVIYLKPFLQCQVSIAKTFVPTAVNEQQGKNGTDGKVSFHLLVFPPDTMVYTDGNMLGQVIVNILKNAIEAGTTRIEIEATVRDDESVEIAISNDGGIIPDEIASQIFTPFFTTRPTGNGIGLSLSRRIITRLGGTLLLSTTPRTRFTINLP